MSDHNNYDLDNELPLADGEISLNQYLVPRPQVYDLKPDEKLLALCPSLDGRDFFAPDKGDTEDEREEIDHVLAACPRNKMQKYTAPPITDVPWPDIQKTRQHLDHDMASIQAKLANATRPLDKFMLDTIVDDRFDDQLTDELLEFADQMRRQLRHISHALHDLRVQNLDKAHGLDMLTKKSTRPAVVEASTLLERKKLLNSLRKNLYPANRRRGTPRTQFHRRGNYQYNQGNNNNAGQQQPHQQQQTSYQQYSDNNSGQYFYNAQGNSNRGRGRGRGRGHQSNPQ